MVGFYKFIGGWFVFGLDLFIFVVLLMDDDIGWLWLKDHSLGFGESIK